MDLLEEAVSLYYDIIETEDDLAEMQDDLEYTISQLTAEELVKYVELTTED